MPLDQEVADALKAQLLANNSSQAQMGTFITQNGAQGLSVIQGAVIQAQASNSDDPAVIAALQTASRSPQGEKSA